VWQFKFVCCPQVLEIGSVAHQVSCSGVGFSLCLFTGGLFLCLTPFLWGQVSDLSARRLRSARCDGLLFFSFAEPFWLWVLLTGSGVSYLPYFRQWLITHPYWPSCLPVFLTDSLHEHRLPDPTPFSSVLLEFPPPCYVLVFISLFILGFFLRGWGGGGGGDGTVCPGGYADLSQGWLGEYCVTIGDHLFGL
jgi:hypothetical protein